MIEKWWGVDLQEDEKSALKRFCDEKNIKYEISGIDSKWYHFEILTNTIERDLINAFLQGYYKGVSDSTAIPF